MATKTMVRVSTPVVNAEPEVRLSDVVLPLPAAPAPVAVKGPAKGPFGNLVLFKGRYAIPNLIDCALSGEPQTVAQLAALTGLSENRVQEHLDYWMDEKKSSAHVKSGKTLGLHLRKTEAGYFVV